MSQIKLLITDFDGTLVDTFEANYKAYKKAFEGYGIKLTKEEYTRCFGYRFDDFMNEMNIHDEKIKKGIRNLKGDYYPLFFNDLLINKPLLELLRTFKNSGGMTAVASTARHKNLMNALTYINATDAFSLILSGEDVKYGKPNPEIYNTVLEKLQVANTDALIFEDSPIGIEAAKNADINYIKITKEYFL